jgi:hypothetical protein
MILEKPYFMSNKEWYYHDEEIMMYKLTDKANEKAKKSYEEFYKKIGE